MNQEHLFSKGKTFLLSFAIIEIVLALVMLFMPIFATEILVYAIGFVMIVSGIVKFASIFSVREGLWPKVLALLLSILFIWAGIYSFIEPLVTTLYLTIFLGVSLIFESIVIFIGAGSSKSVGWSVFNGVITLILGWLILFNLPGSMVFISIYIGVSLLMNGILLLVVRSKVDKVI